MFSSLKDIIFHTKRAFFSNAQGEHLSIFNGSGLEFNEVREYNIDDDIRHINWKITARTKKPSVNIFYENRQINIALVYLNSGGLHFFENSKKNLAITLLSALGFIALNKKDSLTTLFFDEKEKAFFQASKNKNMVYSSYDIAVEINPLNTKINYINLKNFLLENIKSKSIIFFIGDFLEIPNFKELSNKYEIYCLIIREKKEENLELFGEYNIKNPNDLSQKNMNIDLKTINKYNNYMKKYDEELISYFKNNNIKYKKFYTDQNPFKDLKDFLKESK
jgi:hypothetical protein